MTHIDTSRMMPENDAELDKNVEFQMEFDVEEDIEGELEDFVRLARMGLVREARDVFQHKLKPHLELFPVLAEYAEFLLANNAYDELLQILPSSNEKHCYSHGEWWLLGLLHDLAEGHMMGHFQDAIARARDWRSQMKCPLAEFNDVEIQCYEVYLSIMLGANSTSDTPEEENEQLSNREQVASEWQRLCDWSLMLLKTGRQWEAHSIINLLLSTAVEKDAKTLLQSFSLNLKDDNSDSAILTRVAVINHYVKVKLQGSSALASDDELNSLDNLTAYTYEQLQLLFAESKIRGRHSEDCNDNRRRIKELLGLSGMQLSPNAFTRKGHSAEDGALRRDYKSESDQEAPLISSEEQTMNLGRSRMSSATRDDVVTDSKDRHGQKPLSWPAERGDKASLKLPVKQDDLAADSQDQNNQTPTSYAVEERVESIGGILDLYFRVQRTLKTCRRVTSGRYIENIGKDLATQEIIFSEFFHVLLGVGLAINSKSPQATSPSPIQSFGEGSAMEHSPPYSISLHEETRGYSAIRVLTSVLRGSIPNEAVPWRDLGSKASLERLYAPEKVQIILPILKGIHSQLQAIEEEVSNSITGYRPRRGWFGPTFSRSSAPPDSNIVSSSSLQRKLNHLHQLNSRLRRLQEDPKLPLEPTSNHILQTQNSKSLHEIDTADLYIAIKRTYCCDCYRPHFTLLGLPQISALSRQVTRSTRQFTHLGSALSLVFSTHDETSPEIFDDSLKLVQSTESFLIHPKTNLQSLQRFEQMGALATQVDHSKRISHMISYMSSGTNLNSTENQNFRTKSYAVTITECTTDGVDLIRDLCDTVKTLSEKNSLRPATTIGVLRSRKRKRYCLQILKSLGNVLSEDFISLEDLFASNQSRFPRKDRIGLALRLSYAVIRLYSTPWITELWSWKDFFTTRAWRSEDDYQLFISHEFYSTEQPVEASEVEKIVTSDFLQTYIGEPKLTRLGFALTELALGKRLAELRIEEERYIKDKEMQDYRIARRILETGLIRDAEDAQYEDIVKVCLTHQFMSKDLHFRCLNSDERWFQKDAEQLIVAPLYTAWTQE